MVNDGEEGEAAFLESENLERAHSLEHAGLNRNRRNVFLQVFHRVHGRLAASRAISQVVQSDLETALGCALNPVQKPVHLLTGIKDTDHRADDSGDNNAELGENFISDERGPHKSA